MKYYKIIEDLAANSSVVESLVHLNRIIWIIQEKPKNKEYMDNDNN